MTTVATETKRVVFDAGDINAILVVWDGDKQRLRFTPAELRKQIHAADVDASVCRTFGEDDWAFVFADLKGAMELALDILLSNQPKAAPRPGRQTIDVQAVKANIDIVAVAERYTRLRKSGQNFNGLCPLHADKKTPSFFVYPKDQSWHCFGACNQGGDVISLVMAAEHLDFKAAAEALK